MKTKSVSETILPWLKANGMSLGALTGQDTLAIKAAVQTVHLYNSCDHDAEKNALVAFGLLIRCMQPGTRYLAYHAIAHVGDWGFRPVLWAKAGLEPIGNIPRCKNEGPSW